MGEGRAGATFPALFAMIARRHMYQYGTTREQMAAVAVKNHANGAKNPQAHLRKIITMEQALNGKPVSDPLTVYDCSLISDGAAAVLICPLERASEFTSKPVRVKGIAQTSDHVALDEKDDITTFRAASQKPPKRPIKWLALRRTISNSRNCTIVSPLPKSSPRRMSGLSKKVRADLIYLKATPACTASNRSIPAEASKSKGHPVGADRSCADLRRRYAAPRRSG